MVSDKPTLEQGRGASAARFAVIGGGVMAGAIIRGCLRAGVATAGDWVVAEPDEGKRAAFDAIGVASVASSAALADWLGPQTQVILAVKPQYFEAVARESAGLDWGRVVISILAGTPSARIRAALGGGPGPLGQGGARVLRAMPNTPARIGEGATGVALGAGAREGDETEALAIFRGIGPVVERIDEDLMDAFTAVAGSGPAYLFYLAEAMTRAAVELGFEAEMADRVVRQTLRGAGALLGSDTERSSSELRAAVTSKGGTTAAATAVLEAAGVMETLGRALTAARDRGRELAQGKAGA